MKFLAAVLFVLALQAASSIQAATTIAVPSINTEKAVHALFNKFAKEHHVPCLVGGLEVLRVVNGSVAVDSTYRFHNDDGLADVENEVKCTVDSVLRVASVSKAIGSGLVASLVEKGKLRWDDDINKYVSEKVFPKKTFNGTQVTITLRQLITHLSGIRTTTEADVMHDWEFRITNSTQTVAFFAADPLLFKPGSRFYYSNSGWNLIGAIVEAVENRSYDLLIREYMHYQLGMEHSLMDTRFELVPHRASNYRVVKEANGHFHYLPAPITDSLRPFPHWPCGGVISTAGDLLTYGKALLNSYHGRPGGFLKADTVKAMWNYQPPVDENGNAPQIAIDGRKVTGIKSRYVLGWERMDFPVEAKDASLSKLEVVYHIGELGGTNALLMIFPEMNLVVSAIANIGGIGEHLPALGAQVYHILANPK